MSEQKYHGESLLPVEQKQELIQKEYGPEAHRVGLITSLVHAVLLFLPALYLLVFWGLWPGWSVLGKASAAVLSFTIPYWIIEPISYFVVLGIAGTYISFLAGNISNFRLPVSAVAQEVAGVREGSPEGELVGSVAIAASQWVLTVATLAGALVVTAVVAVLPKGVVAAFDWLLPSIWAAIFVQFAVRGPQYALVTLAIAIPLVLWSGLPTWTLIPIMVFVMAVISVVLYNRGIWVPRK